MIEIITPDNFKQTPWKNGKGFTTELAINHDGCLSSFDWRLSIASVAEDGFFSDFSGYLRHLVLIEGNGIVLNHDDSVIDDLKELLDIAIFNGASKTYGQLKSGPINDFNLMTNISNYQSNLETFIQQSKLILKPSYLTFIYSLNSEIQVTSKTLNKSFSVPSGHLLKISNNPIDDISISGSNLIIAMINKL